MVSALPSFMSVIFRKRDHSGHESCAARHCLFFATKVEPNLPLFHTSWKLHLCPALTAVDFSSSGGFCFLCWTYSKRWIKRFFPGMVQKIMILFCQSTTTQQHLFLTSVLWLDTSWNAKPWWWWQHQGKKQKIRWPIIMAQEFSVWKQ